MPERRLVIVHPDGDRLNVLEDPFGLNWQPVLLRADLAAIRWWKSQGWYEEGDV